jgi:hypothetical protein
MADLPVAAGSRSRNDGIAGCRERPLLEEAFSRSPAEAGTLIVPIGDRPRNDRNRLRLPAVCAGERFDCRTPDVA